MNQSPAITSRQAAYLSRLIGRLGKEKYIRVKRRLGLEPITILRLDRKQASKLIRAILQEIRQ